MRAETDQSDPIGWCLAITTVFAALVLWHLAIPSKIYFDEVHYVPAARALLMLRPANLEHPLLGKEAIAAAIALFGDRPLVWRLPSAIMGVIGLFAFGRAVWWASGRRFACIAAMLLLAGDFAWFVQSRIAMLDMVMAGFTMVGLWQVAAALHLPPRAGAGLRRCRLALAGVSLGLAMAAKWSAVPVVAAVGLGLAATHLVTTRRGAAGRGARTCIPGIGLAEAAFWLGSLPLLVYWLSFAPALFYPTSPLAPLGIVPWHRMMLTLQASVTRAHPYQTHWYQWMIDWRGIWYLYEKVDGAQRGVIMLGNPLTMLAGLPALLWCAWAGIRRQRADALAAVVFYAASLGLWLVPGKPVQFYYHYLLPGSFLMAALALALDALWQARSRCRWTAPMLMASSLAIFGWFYPILSAAPLHHGTASFAHWMWLDSWR